jgi:hypothetical protein
MGRIWSITALVLAADSAVDAAGPLIEMLGFDDESESNEAYGAAQLPSAAVMSTTRSGRVPRLSSRYRDNNWVCH